MKKIIAFVMVVLVLTPFALLQLFLWYVRLLQSF